MTRGAAWKEADRDPLGQRWIQATYGEAPHQRRYVGVRDELGNERYEVQMIEHGVTRAKRLTTPPVWVDWQPVRGGVD